MNRSRQKLTWARLAYILYIIHAAVWILLLPAWQGPDEPGHYEYALLMARLHRPPHPSDTDPALEHAIIRALDAADFWRLVGEPRPHPLPHTFAEHPFLQRSGSQLGNEHPAYYIVPALLTRLFSRPALHCRLSRVWSALLGLGIIVLAVRSAPLLWPHAPALQRVYPIILALLPMPTFVHATFNSNVLADVVGAMFFYVLWRLLSQEDRKGWGMFVGVTLTALWIKRTTLLLLPLAVGFTCLRCWTTRAVRGGLVLAGLLLLILWPQTPRWTDGWYLGRAHRPAPRVRLPDGQHAMLLVGRDHAHLREFLVQDVTGKEIEDLRGKNVLLWARLRSLNGPTWTCMSTSDGETRSTACTWIDREWRTWSVEQEVRPTATYMRVVVGLGNPRQRETHGRLLVDDVMLVVQESHRDVLYNGGAERSYHRLRGLLRQLGWAPVPPATWSQRFIHWGMAAAVLFTSFWGNFGWLQRPFPPPLYGILALLTVMMIVGWWKWWRTLPAGPERRVWTFTGLASAWFVLAMFLAAWRTDWLPQGRYIFPALLPLVALGVSGWTAWFPPERKRAGVYTLLGFAGCLTLLGWLTACCLSPAPPF